MRRSGGEGEAGSRQLFVSIVACVQTSPTPSEKKSVFLREGGRLYTGFSIDDGDGSKNVTFKMSSRFFKLCRLYSFSPKKSNVSVFPLS